MKKLFALFLSMSLIFSFAGCNTSTVSSEKDHVLAAWDGDFSEDSLTNAISQYKKQCASVVYTTESEAFFVTFNIDFEAANYRVARLSRVDPENADVELHSYIDSHIDMEVENRTVKVYTDWWKLSTSWTKNVPIWSYLISIEDSDGVNHYYYFRADYSALQS